MSEVILITGASSGIGAELARRYGARGCRLGLTARRTDKLEALAEELRQHPSQPQVLPLAMDVTDAASIESGVDALLSEFSRIDRVIVNAGIGDSKPVGKGDFFNDQRVIETNLIGAMKTVDVCAATMRQQGAGHIIGISSVAAFRGIPYHAAYSASKAGFSAYLEAARNELVKKGIDVTVLHPGFIATPMVEGIKTRPFMISVEKGAELMVAMIDKRVLSATVPQLPWAVIKRLIQWMPEPVWARLPLK